MEDKVLGRIQKLLALAAAEGEEGRTAAHLAARLIREGGFVVMRHRTLTPPPKGFEGLADIYAMLGVKPPWQDNPDWVCSPDWVWKEARTKPVSHPTVQTPPREETPTEASVDPFDFDEVLKRRGPV